MGHNEAAEHRRRQVGGREVFGADDAVEVEDAAIELAPQVLHHALGDDGDGAGEVAGLLESPHEAILEGHQLGGEVGGVADGGDHQPVLAQFGADSRQVRGVVAGRFVGHAEGLVNVGYAFAPMFDLPGGVDVGGGL